MYVKIKKTIEKYKKESFLKCLWYDWLKLINIEQRQVNRNTTIVMKRTL